VNMIQPTVIRDIRRFNRFYTNILGLLDQHMLNSDFSLSEIRVLYEIGHGENCTAKKLIEELKIDSGYLSRIIRRFEKQGLTYRMQSSDDGRLYYLYLTEAGKGIMAELNDMSDQQIQQLLAQLRDNNQLELVKGMQVIEQALANRPSPEKEEIRIRCDLRPGDIGYLIHLHGWIYAQDCGYNHVFEGYVCKTFYEFMANYHSDKDRLWFAEANGEIVGAIAIVGHSPERAQLRWFILHPEFRGRGLGQRLLKEALQYSRDKGYRQLFLETTDDQQTAIRMYTKVGFQKVREVSHSAWGVNHVEQTYELILKE